MLVAQLSDIHLDGASSLERFDRVLRWVAELRPDAVAVSGDLANNSHVANYTLLKARLGALAAPVLVVPGNVDSRDAMHEVFGGPADGPLNRAVAVGDVRLIGLDVIVPGAAHGDATPVLGWLEAELNSGGAPALIFLHQHPFDCGMDEYETIDCRNKEGLAAVIEAARDTVRHRLRPPAPADVHPLCRRAGGAGAIDRADGRAGGGRPQDAGGRSAGAAGTSPQGHEPRYPRDLGRRVGATRPPRRSRGRPAAR